MNAGYTIGKLAKIVRIAPSAIRYYEKAGLIEPAGRTEGNYRVYGPDAVERLHFIRAAQSAGLTLHDVAALLDLRDGRAAPCAEVQQLLERRFAEVRQRLEDLRRVESSLAEFLDLCRRHAADNRCEVIERLSKSPSNPRKCAR